MNLAYEHIAIFSLLGGYTVATSDERLLDTEQFCVWVTSAARDAVRPTLRSAAVRSRIFNGGLPKESSDLESMAEQVAEDFARRNAGSLLVCMHRGEVALDVPESLRTYETDDGRVDVVHVERPVRSTLAEQHAPENARVVAAVCALLEGTARKVWDGLRLRGEGREVVALNVQGGTATGILSRQIPAHRAAGLRALLPGVASRQELSPIAELYVDAMQEQHGLAAFFLGWAAAERLVHHVYAERRLAAQPEPAPPRITLRARAEAVAASVAPSTEQERILREFVELKKQRDDLFHRGGPSERRYPSEEAYRLTAELLRHHLQKKT